MQIVTSAFNWSFTQINRNKINFSANIDPSYWYLFVNFLNSFLFAIDNVAINFKTIIIVSMTSENTTTSKTKKMVYVKKINLFTTYHFRTYWLCVTIIIVIWGPSRPYLTNVSKQRSQRDWTETFCLPSMSMTDDLQKLFAFLIFVIHWQQPMPKKINDTNLASSFALIRWMRQWETLVAHWSCSVFRITSGKYWHFNSVINFFLSKCVPTT